MQQVTLLNGSTGLNVVVDPVRLQYDPERGIQELAVALNVDIDQTGRVSRRRGYERLNSTPCHSLWNGAGRTYCVADGWICTVEEDFSYTQRALLQHPNEKVWFLNVNGDVFWSNGLENGILRFGTIPEAWSFLMPQSESDPRSLSPMPEGKCLELYNGRIWAARENAMFCSEPLGYQACDMARNWLMFESEVRMIRAVSTGLYVGTATEVNYIEGPTPAEFTRTVVSDSPVVQGTCAMIDGRQVLQGDVTTRCVMWTALDGIYTGYPGGEVSKEGRAVNLTKDKLRYPGGSTGSAVVLNDSYLTLIDP